MNEGKIRWNGYEGELNELMGGGKLDGMGLTNMRNAEQMKGFANKKL